MDMSAIENCSDATLVDMGLTKVGDRLALRGFCNQKSDSKTKSRKRGLLEAFLNIRKKPKSSSKSGKKDVNAVVIPAKEKKEKIKTRKIQLGWLHFDEKKQKFVSVRLINGGGTRDVNVPIDSTKDDIVKLCMELFFPNGHSEFAGDANALDFRLANFKNEKIENVLYVGETEVPFTITNYIRAYQTNKVRLYLTSSQKDNYISTTEEESEISALFSVETDHIEEEQSIYDHTYEPNQQVGVMGSSTQRLKLIEEQDLAYEQSLKSDKAKNEALNCEILELQRKEVLRIERSLRVPNEPCLESDAFVIVKVRHISLGPLTRRFSPTDRMESVFDWIGSVSPEPECFSLCLPYGPPLSKNELVSIADRQTLSMVETTILNESDEEGLISSQHFPIECEVHNVASETESRGTDVNARR
jgi:hypothetical protein